MLKIAAGIVLFNPEIERLEENINAIMNQVNLVILIDNNSKNIKEIENIYENKKKIYIYKNAENKGIGFALNQMTKICEQDNYKWLLTLDQDSVCSDNLVEVYKKYIEIEKIGIVTTKIIDRNYYFRNTQEFDKVVELSKCITSGSLISIEVCKEIGYFNEKMFIDLIDFEYCKRLCDRGYKILRSNETILLHQLGDLTVHKIFGKKIYVTNHSPIRKYYYFRNSIYYVKKYYEALVLAKTYIKLIFKMLIVLLYEKEKIKKVKYMLKGIIDGNKMFYNEK